MEGLLSILDGDAKKSVEVFGTSGFFFEAALKCLKRDYGNQVVIAHLRFKALLDHPQLKLLDRIGLRQFHEQLITNNTWLLSIVYKSPLFSFENLTKGLSLLPPVLRQEFYKSTENSVFTVESINLIVFEQWLEKKLKRYFNPIADTIGAD